LTNANKKIIKPEDRLKEFPRFIKPEYIKDGEGLRPDDENYDPSTLYIPKEDFINMTLLLKSYWEIKSKNFDKIIFYRYGNYYALFYQDAMESSKILDLCNITTRNNRLTITGFPISQLQENIEKLVNKGYKVAIAE
jgi:DNA mismatch repair protein MSH6